MHSVYIQLDSLDKVKSFVNLLTAFEGDFDMKSGRYTVDAKSILGIFSLDLSKPIELVIYDDQELPRVMDAVKDYLVQA